jgi:hypothetical protein
MSLEADLAPKDVALQMTLWHWKVYQETPALEFISKERGPVLTPYLHKLQTMHTRVTYWAMSVLLAAKDAPARLKKQKFLVRVTQQFWDLGNFDLAWAMATGMRHVIVDRITDWARFHRKHPRSAELYQQHLKWYGDGTHLETLREPLQQWHQMRNPCIPPLALYSKQLAHIYARESSTVEHRGRKLINLKLCRLLYRHVEELRQYQRYDYAAVEAEVIQVSG